jgi:hypothetical protein
MIMTFRRRRQPTTATSLPPRGKCMPPLVLLFVISIILLVFDRSSISSSSPRARVDFFANAVNTPNELTDDATHPYDYDEGFIGNIPLYLAYDINHGELECLYDNISTPHSYMTSSVYVLATKAGYPGMRAIIIMEGPVAPAGFTLGVSGSEPIYGGGDNNKGGLKNLSSGAHFQKHLEGYAREGGIHDEKAVRSVVIVDFEQAGEDEGDEVTADDAEMKANHDAEMNEERRILNEQRKAAADRKRDHLLQREAKVDDDFVKLQMDHDRANQNQQQQPRRENAEGEAGGEGASSEHHRRRLLEDNIKLSAGLPYERTIEVTIPGWYRLCVGPPPSGEAISVEMELRSGSKLDPHTGHVLSEEDIETHSEIHSLYKEEANPEQRAAIAASIIKEDDLVTTREQLRILERVYSEIIAKQLEERRTWSWRTMKNQKSYGHLVMGNFLETLAYMGITGWQVYTIRRWFGGGPTLGR